MLETYDRIKELRKEHLKLTQAEFGERLGVSRSVIKNIELNALARPDQKLSLYKLICSEFNVNEEWLLDGVGPMFVPPDTFSLDDFARARGATDLEIEIIRAYFDLDPNLRKAVVSSFKNKLTSAIAANPALLVPDTPEELEAMCPPVEMSSEDAG